MKAKITIRDRSRERDDVTGYTLQAMARRMFGRRCSVMANGDTGTVYISNGQIIGSVAIYR